MNAFFFVVDEGLADIATAQAFNVSQLTGCDVHIFVERRETASKVFEMSVDLSP